MILSQEKVWFSHREDKWNVKRNKFRWIGGKQIKDWEGCTFGIVRTRKNKLRIVVHREADISSSYMDDAIVTLRYMLGFDITRVTEPESQQYISRTYDPENKEGPKERWVFQLDDDYWVWQWADKEGDLHTSPVYRIYERIKAEITKPSLTSHNIFDVDVKFEGDQTIPTVYQPSVDGLKNFVREIHCAELSPRNSVLRELQVSIMFNNEQLRQHAFLNKNLRGIPLAKIRANIRFRNDKYHCSEGC